MTKTLLNVVAGIALFATVFLITWYGTFFFLYEYVYGDTYGGRWQHFAWPVATTFSGAAVTAFWVRIVRRKHIGWKTWLFAVFLLVTATILWLGIAIWLILPPLE